MQSAPFYRAKSHNYSLGGSQLEKKITVDGNHAAAYAAYAFTEVASIFPITPSSPMAEAIDEWSAQGKTNLFGQRVKVAEMQSEAGAAGAMHGSLEAGALTTTFTASQGLLLMIPNLYKMVGELLPGVLHVSARAIATHALSIFGDHQDVMACRQTGISMLASANAQEAFDLGCVAHLSAISAHLPFIHFFDGFRTSHEYRNIRLIEMGDLEKLLDRDAVAEFRGRSLNPAHPLVKGTAQNPDIYFQGREVQNSYFAHVPDIVAHYMNQIGEMTGRRYRPFDYYGDPSAESILIAIGSVCDTIKEVIADLMEKGEKVGLLQVRLYRPFSEDCFFQALPESVRRIAVLDRTKEPGAPGEPLYLDLCRMFSGAINPPLIVGGRYGLGSKDTTPAQIAAVFKNLKSNEPQNGFTIGIVDDVTNTSLPEFDYHTPDHGTVNCQFWGLGSDGTVGANKSAIQIIGENTDLNVQAYFSYDSKKSGGTTISHLRFGKNQILSSYLVYEADYVACHNKSFLNHYNLVRGLKPDGIFVLNCDYPAESIGAYLPAELKRYLANNHIRFYIIDALKIASGVGLGNRINMVMQAAFFQLLGIIPKDEAIRLLKESIHKAYGRKGKNIEEMNNRAVDESIHALVKIEVPPEWSEAANRTEETSRTAPVPDFVKNIQYVMARNEGDNLPVSSFLGMEDGAFPLGTTAYEKRGIAPTIPEWQIDKCIQCGQCSYVCPHATVRLFLLDEEEQKRAPEAYRTKTAIGKNLGAYQLRVQISPLDCTGCGNCAEICPAKEKALVMKPAEPQIAAERDNWEFSMTLREKPDLIDRFTVKGSQLIRPLMEFNGACPGCGETPYIRLLTQMFGERMMIANATGCSSIWGASAPSIPYTTNANGRGPAWANSLFEDNAEYGYGMFLGAHQIRSRLKEYARNAADDETMGEEIRDALNVWLNEDDGTASQENSGKIRKLIELPENSGHPLLQQIFRLADYLEKRSYWMIGGDGWAYDIGYGGLDHVLSTGADVNLFVMDTEVYSNTGGQASKSTPTGAVAKFAYDGKVPNKKNLGLMAITYGNVYVAQIAMGADFNQTIRAIHEAESYAGPSLIIAYAPCINHGIKSGMATSITEEKKAVDSGYWHLYRYDPRLREKDQNPFQLDSKEPSGNYQEFLRGEIRYSQLENTFPEIAKKLFHQSELFAKERFEMYQAMQNEK